MPADDLLDCVNRLNVETDLTADGIAAATGRTREYVLGYLAGRYGDRAAEDELGDYPTRRMIEQFVMGRCDGAAVTRREGDGESLEVA